MEVFSAALILVTFFITLYILVKSKAETTKSGFRCYPVVGALPDFLLNRHRFLDWSTEILSASPANTAVFHRPLGPHGILTANPQNVEYMLKANFENFPKGKAFRGLLEDFLGTGIFNSDGEIWKIQRKTASYEFNTKSLRNFVLDNVKFELQTRLVPLLEHASRTDRVMDLQDVLERFAFDNISKLAFNVDPGCLGGDATEGGEFMRAFEDAATLSSGRFMYAFPGIYLFNKFFNLGSEGRLRKSISVVHQFADNIIESRLEQRDEKKDEDLLSRFIGNSDNSAEFLRDIIISFILAGRDTTSSALTWFFWLLSAQPEIERSILNELESIRCKNGKVVGDAYDFDELREMHYLHAAISESMRLYPPVPVDTKACFKDDVLPDGSFIGKKWFITYHTYAMGRMESVWGKDCCEYKPERWLENGICKLESPYKYPVFHAGPRMCLGKEMAYIQMKSIAACVLERFRINVVSQDGRRPMHLLSLTLRMKGGAHGENQRKMKGQHKVMLICYTYYSGGV